MKQQNSNANSQTKLSNKRVAVLATDGYEQSELTKPVEALKNAGAIVKIVSVKDGEIQGFKHDKKGDAVKVDLTVDNASVGDFDALILPGGVFNPDALRTNNEALEFIKAFNADNKCIAAICHGPQLLINAELVEGRKLTSFHSIRKDLENAGADWQDGAVVIDSNLITSRNPDDLNAFSDAIIQMLQEGKHSRRAA